MRLLTVPPPDTGVPSVLPTLAPAEYEQRLAELYRRAATDWVVVYGDREHAANLQYLCGFDPRFEEALLLLGSDGRRLLVVGNEDLDYAASVSPWLDRALCQSFSLIDQDRSRAPRLAEVLRAAGVAGALGVVGWKYLTAAEAADEHTPAFVPAMLVAALSELSDGTLVDRTAVLMAADGGMRGVNSAAQIAAFEWGGARASAAMMRIIHGVRPGISELDAAANMGYAGEQLTCHVMLSADASTVTGLRSPGARPLGAGDAITGAVGYPGGLCSRAGVLTATLDADLIDQVVSPYFDAVKGWYETLAVGVSGGELHAVATEALAAARLRPALNPGHLGSYDEWPSSPVKAHSTTLLSSGAVLQCDIIPTPLPAGVALNCEDTVALGDANLRDELAREHPELWRRIERRRRHLIDELGIAVGDDILPLSDSVARLAPAWLDPGRVCVAEN